MTEKSMHSVKQLAEVLDVSEQSIRRWLKSGLINAVKVRKKWLISPEEVQRIKQNGIQG